MLKIISSKVSAVALTSFIILTSCKNEYEIQKEKIHTQKPNIILILADDLGYGELGSYGQSKIETPNIDKLAESGMKFLQHYSGSAVCAPSRFSLLTGQNMGDAYIRGNDEWNERGDVWNFDAVENDASLEGQRPLPDSIQTLGNLLQSSGYKTGLVGKWGLGAPLSNSIPNKKGFDFFYGYNCQKQAHTYYPTHLWKNQEKELLSNKLVAPHKKIDEKINLYDESAYLDFNQNDYAPDLMQREVINFIKGNKNNPFFLYYATTIPHVALQAPKRWIDYYVNKFGDEEPYDGSNGYFPCRYPHATYAAMISYLDEQVGEIISELKRQNIYENTLVIFTSDNGPSYAGGADPKYFNSGGIFESDYGRGKGFLYEAGIRVPFIASWPDNIPAGSTTDHISAFWDILPTFCDIADANLSWEIDGKSFLPTLLGNIQNQPEYLYFEIPEYGGQQAVRLGKYKGIRKDIKKGNTDIELYDLENDISEQNDIAGENPKIVKEIEQIFIKEHTSPILPTFRMKNLGD